MNGKTYNRCEFIIRQFMSVEKPTAELMAMFHDWLLNGRHCREKNVVIRRLFYESLSDAVVPAPSCLNGDSAPDNEFLEKLLAVKKV